MRSLDSASAFHAAQSSRTRLCLAILALLSSSPVLAQVASVTTSVAGQNGSPAAQQRVTLANPATGFAAEAVTNVQGQAHFAAVPAGEFGAIEIGLSLEVIPGSESGERRIWGG